jgi:signal transduction histidine kinase
MLTEILVGVLVVAVAVLVVTDSARTKIESSYGHTDGLAHDGRPRVTGDTRGGHTGTFFREPGGTGIPAAGYDAGPARHPEGLSPPVGGYQHSRTGAPAAPNATRPELKSRHVRSRLLLLVTIPAAAVAIIALCVGGLTYVLQGSRVDSPSSSTRDGAILSALALGVVMVVVLVLAPWLTIVTARSVLQPLYRLRVRALDAVAGRRPDAAHGISENDGENAPTAPEAVDADSTEIGDVARAVNQMGGELLRMAANEAALRGKLDAMFVNMSNRGQSLVERQIRIIENLEHSEQDRERLAHLARMNRIASRMHRNSQNLLVLAGHELSIGWNQPMALVNVIRAAVSEIEENERISLHAQPDVAVSGPVVNDAVHLFAELTENATSFSAVDVPVEISGYQMNSGVVIDITDRGVGMSAKELAYANWRLENPPTADIDVPRWIGLFVVARLAARHGVKVRLQQAEFGGLTALVWLPNEIIVHHGAAAPSRLSGSGGAGPRRGAHEAAGDLGRGPVERGVATARSAELTSPREDARGAQLGRRLTSDAGRRPGPVGSVGPAASAGGGWSASQVPPPAAAGPSRPGSPTAGQTAAPLGQETSSADSGVIVPPAEARRLPIFDAVEARWFSGGREVHGTSGVTATAARRWSSPGDDEDSRAAQTVEAPTSGAPTLAGLPRRLPNANLVPGSIPGPQPVAPLNRSAPAARDRFAGFQRGVSEGRTATSSADEVPDSGGEDES